MPAGGLLADRLGAGRDRDESSAQLPRSTFHADFCGPRGRLGLFLDLGRRQDAHCPYDLVFRHEGDDYNRPRRGLPDGFRLSEGLPHGYACHNDRGYAGHRQR